MSIEFFKHLILDLFLMILIFYGFLYEKKMIVYERRFFEWVKRGFKIIKNIFKVLVIGRKKYMLVILKSPGGVPQRIHILNNIKNISEVLDAEQVRSVRICKDVRMCYDVEAFNKQKPFGLTDEYASKFYYGDVIFYALGKDGYPRSLTLKEIDLVERYIRLHKTDKFN